MSEKLELSREEMGLLELALDDCISTLRNRFEDENGYIHPAIKYENLYEKIFRWRDPIDADNFTLETNEVC